jgi:hypothetical protein
MQNCGNAERTVAESMTYVYNVDMSDVPGTFEQAVRLALVRHALWRGVASRLGSAIR